MMVHQYKNNGYNILLDVNSGAVHVVDDIVYDMIPMYENMNLDEINAKLGDKYKADDIRRVRFSLQAGPSSAGRALLSLCSAFEGYAPAGSR